MNVSRFVQWRNNNPQGYEALLHRRRESYQTDEDRRLKQLQHNANYRKKVKSRAGEQKRSPRQRKPKIMLLNNRSVEFWSVGRMAAHLGISKRTITALEDEGRIPINRYVDQNNHRWWPAEFVRWLKPFFDARKDGVSAREFHRRVWIGWSEEQARGVVPMVGTGIDAEETDGDSTEGHEQADVVR